MFRIHCLRIRCGSKKEAQYTLMKRCAVRSVLPCFRASNEQALCLPSPKSQDPLTTNRRPSRGTQFLRDLLQIICRIDVDDLVHLGRVPEEFFRARVQHPKLTVACNREVKEQDVGHRYAARILYTSLSSVS